MLAKRLLGMLSVIALAACSNQTPAQVSAPAARALAVELQANPSVTVQQIENDRICKLMYGLTCHAIPLLLGPVNAKLLGENRACVHGGIAKLIEEAWIPDNRYVNRETGERYGDGCIAVSL